MRRVFIWVFCFIFLSLTSYLNSSVNAFYNPLAVPNNRVGIHILDTSEVFTAAKLVNSSGGDWGYITIPISSNDRRRDKWLEFFKNCRQLHLIPILRLATYFQDNVWVTPNAYDLVDFANFLSEMPWPTSNRYIILFNEPNHSKEWGGQVNPSGYASLLLQAKPIFKSRSSDYFLLTAGLDMSAPTNHTSLDALSFYRQMTNALPNWYTAVDGFSFHAYPNPGFSASISSTSRFGLRSYTYELQLFSRLNIPDKPLFITETGSITGYDYFTPAFTQIWTQSNIVAVTPFLLFAGSGEFMPFSFLDSNHQPKSSYKNLSDLPKTSGSPLLGPLFPNLPFTPSPGQFAVPSQPSIFDRLSRFLHPSPANRLHIGQTVLNVEIADTETKRSQGLSGRENLPDNTGMLFIFPASGNFSFWMKDMKFALDFVWIRDKKILRLDQNVPPPAQTGGIPAIINPYLRVDQVLEVPSGFISQHDLKVNDSVILTTP